MPERVSAGDITLSITSLKRPWELEHTLSSVGEVPRVQVILNGARKAQYRDVISRYRSRVSFLWNPTNLGIATAFNQGIVTADTRFVVLSGDDLQYQDGWLERLLEALNADNPPLQLTLCDTRAFSCFCIDKSLIVHQGWFDQNFTRVYYEDDDWCLRTMEREGGGSEPTSAQWVMPKLAIVRRPDHTRAAWNSIPNRLWFWRKWERLKYPQTGSMYLRPQIVVRRRLPEPRWPFLELVRGRYSAGDFRAAEYVYDAPRLGQRVLTRATTNAVFVGLRKVIQRAVNPEQELR